MEPNGILVDRTNSNNIMNSSITSSPKARPLPQFFLEQSTFSTKKENRHTPKLCHPPPLPVRSCPPISRLKPFTKSEKDILRKITFAKNLNFVDKAISSPFYDGSRTDLFFEQCFVNEGSLGCGSFGKVYRVRSKEDGKCYAIKKSKEKFKGTSDRDRKLQEVAKHEELPHHPNCVRFYRAWEEKQRLYIQTELCQTSLNKYAETHHDIPEAVIWAIIVDLLQALKHLHDRNLAHMDIKPDNIFITFNGHYKLGDFGLVIDLKNADLKEVREGDQKYLAPEILQNSINITCAADTFSLGMTILELATDLDVPRSGDLWHELRTGKIPAHLTKDLSPELSELIISMMEPDHLKRASVNVLLNTPKVKYLILSKDKSLKYYVFMMYKQLVSLATLTWYFIVWPYQYVRNGIGNENLNLFGDGGCSRNVYVGSSTPKKIVKVASPPRIFLNENKECEHETQEIRYINLNDTLSGNNSYCNALNDSSSFGDLSGFSNHNRSHTETRPIDRKLTKTEPAKYDKKTIFLKIENTYSNPTSPFTTPPGKPMSDFYLYHDNTTPNGPTKKKLIFDEYGEAPVNDVTRSRSRTPPNRTSDRSASSGDYDDDNEESGGEDGEEDSSDCSTEQISVKLNYKL